MAKTETETRPLPPTLILANVPIDQALLAIADRLTDLAGQMSRVSDINVDIDIASGRASLQFRCTR